MGSENRSSSRPKTMGVSAKNGSSPVRTKQSEKPAEMSSSQPDDIKSTNTVVQTMRSITRRTV